MSLCGALIPAHPLPDLPTSESRRNGNNGVRQSVHLMVEPPAEVFLSMTALERPKLAGPVFP